MVGRRVAGRAVVGTVGSTGGVGPCQRIMRLTAAS